jgi:hypothetical protein
MKIKLQIFWVTVFFLLTSCGISPVQPVATAEILPTLTSIVNMQTPSPAFNSAAETSTAVPALTLPPPFPTVSGLSPRTPTPTIQLTPTSLHVSDLKFSLDGYVMLFTKDEDLYFQDENNSPIMLDHVGEASYKLSDDNQKVVVIDSYEYAYSYSGFTINTDGTERQPVIFGDLRRENVLWGAKIGLVDFVPGTHKVIFSVHSCNSYDHPTVCVSSLFLSDGDIGKVKKITDLGFSGSGGFDHRENFKVSPNGKMVAIMTTSSVDILDMDGRVLHHDILTYKPNTPTIIFPSIFWLPDSSGLIVGLPNTLFDSVAYNYVPAYTIWRYEIDGNRATQIHFDPPPMAFSETWGGIQVSPDGTWIIYGGLGNNPEVYLGDLTNGQTRIIGEAFQADFSWAPDSRHFIVGSAGSRLMAIDTPGFIPVNYFFGWVDGSHLKWVDYIDNTPKAYMAEIVSGGLNIYDLGFDKDVGLSFLIKPK